MVSFKYTACALIAALSMLQGAQAAKVVPSIIKTVGLKVRGTSDIWERAVTSKLSTADLEKKHAACIADLRKAPKGDVSWKDNKDPKKTELHMQNIPHSCMKDVDSHNERPDISEFAEIHGSIKPTGKNSVVISGMTAKDIAELKKTL